MLKKAKKLNPMSILDVGCGEGFTLLRLKDENIGKKLSGIDNSDRAISYGKKNFPFLHIKKGDVYKLPFKDNSFDLVLCMEVLEHLDNPIEALIELRRVSRKYVLLSVPNEPLFTYQRFLRGQNMKKFGSHPEHVQHWSTKAFKRLVSEFMHVIDSETPLPWTILVAKK
jgi:ubiquinone/menaquinone biosynthesis C-methylase UbiE